MREKRKSDRRESLRMTALWGALAAWCLALGGLAFWRHRLAAGILYAMATLLCAAMALLERERQNAREYIEDVGMALELLRKYRGDAERAAEEEAWVCPRCGGRIHHTVGGKQFCSLCLEEMRHGGKG